MALSRVKRMERLRVSVETRAQILLGDARLGSERASGESLRKACPALLSVMSGFIRRDRGLNCINSRLFPIVFWWNLQPIKAAQLRTEDSPRIPEDQLNKEEEEKNHNVSATPPLYSPLSSSRFILHLPFHQFLSVCRHSWCGHFLHWSCCSWPIGGVFELIIIPESARYNPCPYSWRKNKSCNRSWIERLCNPSVYYIKTSCVSVV